MKKPEATGKRKRVDESAPTNEPADDKLESDSSSVSQPKKKAKVAAKTTAKKGAKAHAKTGAKSSTRRVVINVPDESSRDSLGSDVSFSIKTQPALTNKKGLSAEEREKQQLNVAILRSRLDSQENKEKGTD